MHSVYKTRTSDDDVYVEHLKKQKSMAAGANRKQVSAPVPPPPPPPSKTTKTTAQQQTDSMHTRQNSTTVGIYVTGGGFNRTIVGTDNVDAAVSKSTTLDRQQHNRMSWSNMRKKIDEISGCNDGGMAAITPSPQTTRSYISTVSTVMDGGGNGVGHVGGGDSGSSGGNGGGEDNCGGLVSSSGRTTVASGRISTSGIATISGSNNTLNDIISDYHSHEAGSSDYRFAGVNASSPTKNFSNNGSFNITNGSTVKLLPPIDDDTNQQTTCSVFRGLVLCICLNVTFPNVVRFPRELDKYGSAYLIPYLTLLFLVGLPLVLLEISVGQFLGQGAAHTWRVSPIFKGACIISRFASWLSGIWVSLQAVLAVSYTGMFLTNALPFRECVGNVKMALNGYAVIGNSGQECLQKTFLTPFWENPLYFVLLSIGLISIWIVVMLCTHNSKVLRRCLFFFGLMGFALLCCVTGWEVHNSLNRSYFPELWPFDSSLLIGSNIWFNALMQILFAVNGGCGALPILTGKFLYKGDAVRTSVIYICFNLLINAIAVTLFMVQFDLSANGGYMIEELKPLTAIYDRILYDKPSSEILVKLIPSLIYSLIVIVALISIIIAIYTATRLVPRHPNYIVSLVALMISVITLAAPKFIIVRILDTRVVGTIVMTALVFELIANTWIYGAKNIYTDLEFSIGRPIFKGWVFLWCLCPAIVTGLLVWWCSDDDQFDLMAVYLPRWAPILFVLAIIFLIACIQIFRQVEYNFFGMICEASKSAKEWGPADPLARHAWKQWRSVCQDTGRRDFTLRRRGTRDYTHSIKKGQYSASSSDKYANGHATQQNWKSYTPGNSSPNYSGSVFGDSAIEEDISVDKYPGVSQQFVPFQVNEGKPLRYSQRTRQTKRPVAQQQTPVDRQQSVEKHREVVYIRRISDEGQQHATRIEITPSNESITYAGSRIPLANKSSTPHNNSSSTYVKRLSNTNGVAEPNNRNSVISVGSSKLPPPTTTGNGEHICWRKFSVNTNDFSTEL